MLAQIDIYYTKLKISIGRYPASPTLKKLSLKCSNDKTSSFFLNAYNIQMDKLVCLLCQHSYKQPKMCSNCSEIFCQKCINAYLSQHHLCPKCQIVLPELVDCTRLIAEVKNHVKTSPKRKFKNCRLHTLPLKYQCLDCSTPICADCGVIDEHHRGHHLQPRNSIGSTFPKGKLREYLVSVEECILRDHSKHQQLVLEREVLRSELRWCKNKLREYYEEMNKKLDEEADKIMGQISQDLQEKEKKIERLKKIKEDITEVLQFGDLTDEQLIQKISPENELLQQLQLQNTEQLFAKLESAIDEQKQGTIFNFNRKSLTSLEVYPQYVNQTYQFNYQINQFANIKYSEPFHIYGQQWRLKIYPKGNGQSPNHLSLFLQMLDEPHQVLGSSKNVQNYYFRLELISLNTAGKTISKQYRSPFTKGDCWGYNDFVDLDELHEFLNNGHLIFVVGIRNCSYYDVCENMKRYIRKLESEKKVLEELLGGRSPSMSGAEQLSLNSSRTSRIMLENSYAVDSD